MMRWAGLPRDKVNGRVRLGTSWGINSVNHTDRQHMDLCACVCVFVFQLICVCVMEWLGGPLCPDTRWSLLGGVVAAGDPLGIDINHTGRQTD